MYIFLDVHMFMFMFLFAWDSSNSSGEGPNYLKINLDMNSKLGSSKALHVSPCTVTSVHCGIFLFWRMSLLISAQARLQWVTPKLLVFVPFFQEVGVTS